MEAAAAGDAEVTSATASPTYQWKLVGRDGGDRRSGDDLGQGDGKSPPIRTKNTGLLSTGGPEKKPAVLDARPQGRAPSDHGHDIGGDPARPSSDCSTPWRNSAARMEAATDAPR